jgi:hypothetical protein
MEKKNLTVLVGANDTVAGDGEAISAGVTDEVALYSLGDMATMNAAAVTTAAGGQGIFFGVTMADGKFYKSDIIMPRNITQMTEQADIDAVGQRTTIDGIDNIDCETEYCVKIKYDSPEIAKNYGYQAMVKTYSYVTRCCGTECGCPDGSAWDVAMGLVEQINNDGESGMNLDGVANARTVLAASVLNSTSPTASNDPDEIWTLTQGSNIINCATDIDYASGTDVAAGDFIRIMNGGGTVTTAAGDVFRVESADASALTITLDRPWPHATQNLDTTGDAEVIPKATGEAFADSTWSVIIDFADGDASTGIVANAGAGSMKYTSPYVVKAEVGLECNLNCNATVTETTAAVMPTGLGYEIIQKELWANKGAGKKYGPYSGNTLYSRPVVDEDYFAVPATAYTQYIIDWEDRSPSAATDSYMPRPKRLIIAVPTASTTVTAEMNAIMDTLNADFGAPFHSLGS